MSRDAACTRLQAHIRWQYGGRYFANFVLYRADRDGSHIRLKQTTPDTVKLAN